jgi:hypothetical protein
MHVLLWQPSTNKSFGHLGLLAPSKSSFCFKFCIFFMKDSHSKALCYGVSKWKFRVCQSIHKLCRTSQNNPMRTWFLGHEMTLMTTLLVWEPMATSNGLVSCVIGFDERLRPSMTLISIGVLFSIEANLYCCTNSFYIKHVDAP